MHFSAVFMRFPWDFELLSTILFLSLEQFLFCLSSVSFLSAESAPHSTLAKPLAAAMHLVCSGSSLAHCRSSVNA